MSDYQCLSSSNGDLLAVRAAADAAVISDPVQTDTVVPTGGAAGVGATLRFPIPAPNKPTDTGRLEVVASVAWEVTVAGGAAATGHINVTLLRNGVEVPNVTVQNGQDRALDAIGGPFRDTLRAFAPSLRLDADDTLEIGVQIEVVNVGAAGNATVRVHHDPAVLADSLPAELDQVGEATESHIGVQVSNAEVFAVEPGASAQDFSATPETLTQINTVGAAAVINTLDFECRPRQPFRDERVDILALIRSDITATGGAGATGRVSLTATLNGNAIAGVVQANGNAIALDALSGPNTDLLHIIIPQLSMDADDVLEIGVQIERVAGGAAGTADFEVRHNPQVAGSELFIEAMPLS